MDVPEKLRVCWLAHSDLDRHRPIFTVMQFLLFCIGAIFWIDANTTGVGFKEETWGSLAYSLPAEAWAFMNMASSTITMIGLARPIKGWMVAIGTTGHLIQFMVLSYSATMCGGVFVVGLYASVFFMPLHIWLLFEAVRRD